MKNKYSWVFVLLKQSMATQDDLRNAIWQVSQERTTKLTELSTAELRELEQVVRRWQRSTPADRMRKKIFGLLYTLKWVSPTDPKKVYKVNELVIKHGYLKPKGLQEYTQAELPKLISQFEQIVEQDKQKNDETTV